MWVFGSFEPNAGASHVPMHKFCASKHFSLSHSTPLQHLLSLLFGCDAACRSHTDAASVRADPAFHRPYSGATLTGHILAPLFRGSAKHLVGVESMMERGRALGQLLVKQVPICLYFCPAMFMCQCEVSAGDAVGDVGCTAHSAPMWVCCLHRDVGPQCQSPIGD